MRQASIRRIGPAEREREHAPHRTRSTVIAAADAARLLGRKRVRYVVQEFRKSCPIKALRADVQRCLDELQLECAGPSLELKQARERIEELQTRLDADAKAADDMVDRGAWVKRLELFIAKPWG